MTSRSLKKPVVYNSKPAKIQIMKSVLLFRLAIIVVMPAVTQVDIDKPINLSGGSGDRVITNLELPVNPDDAASKSYLDQEIEVLVGGSGLLPGELHGGGVVFQTYKDSNGATRGLAVSLVENRSGTTWSNLTTTSVGTTDYWNGVANTSAIIAQDGHSSSAAKTCGDYSFCGFDDWFLPAQAQLFHLWTNSFMVNQSLAEVSGADLLAQESYWPSTESANSSARRVFFNPNNFTLLTQDKASSFRVRCIRAL